MQQNALYILQDDQKGRGVYAGVDFTPGDAIEICPVIVISPEDREIIHTTRLHDYYFTWGVHQEEAAIALGYGSIYNHSRSPNARFILDVPRRHIIIECTKPIAAGDEIMVNYMEGSPRKHVWFKVAK